MTNTFNIFFLFGGRSVRHSFTGTPFFMFYDIPVKSKTVAKLQIMSIKSNELLFALIDVPLKSERVL